MTMWEQRRIRLTQHYKREKKIFDAPPRWRAVKQVAERLLYRLDPVLPFISFEVLSVINASFSSCYRHLLISIIFETRNRK
jgi:hypothetical protein